MRGAHGDTIQAFPTARIIPADAGSTQELPERANHGEDHPRVCGEHNGMRATRRLTWGSSPRMRGAPAPRHPGHPLLGIIPAYAGSTTGTLSRRAGGRDHPRVCGEHTAPAGRAGVGRGSSPRMWGAPASCCGVSAGRRIIPAYAGSTPLWQRSYRLGEDHPRVCGEHP